MGSSASTRVASPGGSAVVGQTGIMGRSWLTGVAYSATVCRWRNSMAGCRGARQEGAARLPRLATYAEVMSGPQSGNGERGSVAAVQSRSEEHTSELQSRQYLVCRLLLEKKKARDQA